jgi:type I restriction enzyme S subunit
MSERRVPRIRFRGFEDDWEQRKLGDIFEEYSEKGHPELPALTIIQGGGTIRRDESERSLQYDKASLSNYKVVNEDDFIVHLRSFEGGLEKATNLGIVSPAYHIFHGEGADPRFYYSYFRSPQFINQDLKPHVYGIRDGRSIDIGGMKTIEIPWTSYTEQRAIGDFIDVINHLITLHQRKLEKLKMVKKAMLENCFPKNGEKSPRIRFGGFTDDWEQRKLGEVIADLYNGQTPSRFKEEYWNGDISWLSSGELNRGHVNHSIEKITKAGQESAHLRLIPRKTFVMAITGLEAPGTRGNCAILDIETTLNQSCMALFPKKNMLTSEFLFQWYRKVGEDYGIRFTQGTKQQSYNAEIIKDLDICLPKVDEQKKISDCLDNIDNFITLHQCKLAKLKDIKKSMLEKMFV